MLLNPKTSEIFTDEECVLKVSMLICYQILQHL